MVEGSGRRFDAGGLDQRGMWRHFHEHPATFADAEPRLRFLAREVERRRSTAAARVLNVGVGAGYLERLGLRSGWRVYSLDPDPVALAALAAEGVLASAGLVERLPFRDGSFEFVIVSEVLEHLDETAGEGALDEIARVLGTNGRIVGTVPYDEELASQRTVCPECGLVFHRWGHQRSFDRRSMQRQLGRRFEIEELRVTAFPARDQGGLYGWLKTRVLLRRLLLRLGEPISVPTLYFAATRK